MTLQIVCDQNVNDIIIEGDRSRLSGMIHIEGMGNSIRIGEPVLANAIDIHLQGDNNRIEIGAGLITNRLTLFGAGETQIQCGTGLRIIGDCRIKLPEPSSVFIGDDCMFSDQIEIMTSDFHPIFDLRTGERINHAQDIHIGSHVWVGARAILLKGTQVGDNSIIGIGAVLGRAVPENCIALGNPAKVVREGIFWRIPF